MMFLADTGSALTTLAVVLMLAFGSLQIGHIYLLVILSSLFAALQEPAYSASVTMLVPKKDLGRANGLLQLSQALETIATPLIAGVLFVAIDLRGILLIDFITYFAALAALLVVRIPQPKVERAVDEIKPSAWKDFSFGWSYLRCRPGLFGLLLYYAMVNFLLNLSGVLMGPLVLSNHNASVFGTVQTFAGGGMLLGSIAISAWGGPKGRRIPSVIGFIALAFLGLIIAGLGINPLFPIVGYLVVLIFVPLASGSSQVVFQTKVAPQVQGRVFSVRAMLSRSMMPLAFLLSGPLADRIFEPLMRQGGPLASTLFASALGLGPGRGIGLLFILCGLLALLVSLLAFLNPRIRNLEIEVPMLNRIKAPYVSGI